MTNSQAAIYESWLMRCLSRTPGFSQSNILPTSINSQSTKTILPTTKSINRATISPIIRGYWTQGLTYLLDGQGKHVWLIVSQLPLKVGCWDAPLTLQDLAMSNLDKQHSPTATSKISHCLQPTSNYKVKIFFLPATANSTHIPDLTSKAHPFLTACRRSKENFSISGDTKENLCTHPLAHKMFFPLFHIRNKKMKS